MLGCQPKCLDARMIHELVVNVDKKGDLLSMKYIFADGSISNASGKTSEDLQKMNIILHQSIAQSLIKMLNDDTNPRVKLTCNGEKDVSIPHFLIKLGFIPVNLAQE